MQVIKYDASKLTNKSGLSYVCDNCRVMCSTGNVYYICLATNKNNGLNLMLCEDCVKLLKRKLSDVVE